MNELEAALNAYNEAKSQADLVLADVPARVRPGRESQKRDAQAKLPDLKATYREALQRASLGFVVLGPGADAFATIASQEAADVLVADAKVLYERIASRVEPTLGTGREFGVSQFSIVIQELRDIAAEIGVASMPAPRWLEGATVKTLNEVVDHVRKMVEVSIGPDLLTFYLQRIITDAGLTAGSDRTTVPVVVKGFSSPEMANAVGLKLFPEGRQVFVNTTEEVTQNHVIEVLNKAKKQLKTKKN